MKKLLSCLIALVLLLTGCELEEYKEKAETILQEEKAAANDADMGVPASFTEYQLKYTDPEGYSYVVTCQISPWILQSNSGVLNATWNSIAKDKELPTINTWGFMKTGAYYTYKENYFETFNAKIDDMYYAVGTLKIENVTEGYHFDSDRVGYPKIQISKDLLVNYESKLITRYYAGNEVRTSGFGVIVNAKMTSDTWGPLPFVIAFAEHYTPNEPNGESYDRVEKLPLYLSHTEVSNRDSVQIYIKRNE